MSQMQKGFSMGSIVTALVMSVLLGVMSWVGNETFKNSKDGERISVIIAQQVRQSERLIKSIDKLNDTIEMLNGNIQKNREDIIRLKEWYHIDHEKR